MLQLWVVWAEIVRTADRRKPVTASRQDSKAFPVRVFHMYETFR